MLIVDIHALQTVDFLNLIDKVLLQFLLTQHGKNVVRVTGAIHQRVAGLQALAFLHVDVNTARDGIFALFAIVTDDVDAALSLHYFAEADNTVDLRHDRGVTRLARFEQFDDTRQTAGDVFGLRGFTRNLRQNIGCVYHVTVAHHQMRMRRHQVLLGFGAAAFHLDLNHRLALFIGRIHHDKLRHTGNFIHLFGHGHAFDQILEVNDARGFSQDRERIRIPFEQDLVRLHGVAIFDQDLGAVNNGVAFFLAVLFVHHRDDAGAVHGD